MLGMTRTGKSNMIKQLVSVVKRVADEGGVKIGQIIYDINGEYANANQQDKGSIADIYPTETVRYRMLQTPGFDELQNNFYIQLNEGFNTIREVLKEKGTSSAAAGAACPSRCTGRYRCEKAQRVFRCLTASLRQLRSLDVMDRRG